MIKQSIEELNGQYKQLRNNGLVSCISLATPIGFYDIKNKAVISKVLDLLIHESQKQIESEVNK
jgi:hypothetical protein